jgi:hypothetical protein
MLLDTGNVLLWDVAVHFVRLDLGCAVFYLRRLSASALSDVR